VKHIIEEIIVKAPKLIPGITVALIFLVVGFVFSQVVGGFSDYHGLLVWTSFFIVGALFLIKTLFEAVTLGDDAVKSLLNRIGIHETNARDRILKEIMYIVITILAAAAVFPFLYHIGDFGVEFQVIGTYIVLAIIIVLVYDVGRTLHQVSRRKAKRVTDWIGDQSGDLVSENMNKSGGKSILGATQLDHTKSVTEQDE
jgi:hypothetical protein